MAINVPVSANTRPMEKQILAALNKNYKVNLNSKGFSQPLGKITGQLGEFEKSLEASNARVIAFGASAGAIYAVQVALRKTVSAAIDVEKRLADINVILNTSAKSLDNFGNQLFKIAGQTGQTFETVATAAQEFARQGLSLEKTLLRTRDALILTRLSGLDVTSSVSSLTAAINSFSKAALDSTQVVNKLANVDAAFAVSSADLANAVTRVGSAAQDAGVSFDELIAIVTAAQQTTSRGGAVIGNSFKTIFTRIQRPKTLQELEKLGLTVRDLQGNVKPAIQILGDLARTFDSLESSQKSQIAELVGGVFQINILKAALGDLNKQYSIYDNALQTSLGSTDEAIQRNDKLNKTLSALLNETFANLTNVAARFGEGAFGPAIRSVLESVNSLIKPEDAEQGGSNIAKGLLSGIGKFISGPGLVIAGSALVKIFVNLTRFAADAFKSIQNLNIQSANQKKVQQDIGRILDTQPAILEQVRKGNLSIEAAADLVLNRYKAQQAVLQQNLEIVNRINQRASKEKIRPAKGVAGGSIPRFAGGSIVDLERSDARKGGYVAGDVIASPIGGVMNTAETLAYDSRFSQPFINPPEGSPAGRTHKNKSINKLGIDPYSLPQMGFAAGGMPEAFTYPFRMMQGGVSKPVSPKDVAKYSRDYELQLLSSGLAKLGFTDAKDLNAIFGSNVQADFFARKSGVPYLIDAKAGYNDAKLSQIEKKGATIASLRKSPAYLKYIESLGVKDSDIRTAIIYGNAGTQQQKTLRKKGILRSANGLHPIKQKNYTIEKTAGQIGLSNKGFKNIVKGGSVRGLEGRQGGYADTYDKLSLSVDSTIMPITRGELNKYADFQGISQGDALEKYAANYLKKSGFKGIQNFNQIKGDKTFPIDLRSSRKLFEVKSGQSISGSNLISKAARYQVLKNGKLPVPVKANSKNEKANLGKLNLIGLENTNLSSSFKGRGHIPRAKGSIPNFAKGKPPKIKAGSKATSKPGDGNDGGGDSSAGILAASFIIPTITEGAKSLAEEGSDASKRLDVFGDATNTATSTFYLLNAFGNKLPPKFKIAAIAIAAVSSTIYSLNSNFSKTAVSAKELEDRIQKNSELQQKFSDSSSGYLSALSNYQDALRDGSDVSAVTKRFKEVEQALGEVPAEYRANLASLPDFDSLKEEVARIQKELSKQQGLDKALGSFSAASEAGFFQKLNPFGAKGSNVFDKLKPKEFADSLLNNVNPEKLFSDIAGGGVDINEKLKKALAGGSLDEIIAALGITGQNAEEFSNTLANTPISEITKALQDNLKEREADNNQTKLTSALLKEKNTILAEYSKKVQEAKDRLKSASTDFSAFGNSLSNFKNVKKSGKDFFKIQEKLKTETDAGKRLEYLTQLQDIAESLDLTLDPEKIKQVFGGSAEQMVTSLTSLAARSNGLVKKDVALGYGGNALLEKMLGIKDGPEAKKLDNLRESLSGVTAANAEYEAAQKSLAKKTQDLTTEFKGLPTKIEEAAAKMRTSSPGKASGFIPNFASAAGERAAAKAGGYTAGAIKHVSIPGVGRVMANSAETIKQFPGMSQPAIMPPSFSKAGKNYAKAFSKTHGFNPYAAGGFVPNFANPIPKGILYLDRYLSPEAVKSLLDKFDPSALEKFIKGNPKIREKLLEYAGEVGAFTKIKPGVSSSNLTRAASQGLPTGFTPRQLVGGFFDDLKGVGFKAKDKLGELLSKGRGSLNNLFKISNPFDAFSNYKSRYEKFTKAYEEYKDLRKAYSEARKAGASGNALITIINKIDKAKTTLEKATKNNFFKEGVSNLFDKAKGSLSKAKGLGFKGGSKLLGKQALKLLGPIGTLYEAYKAVQQFRKGDIGGGIQTTAKGILYAIPGVGTILGTAGEGVDYFTAKGLGLEDIENEEKLNATLREQTKERVSKAKTTLQKQLAIANETGILPKGYDSLASLKRAALEENLRTKFTGGMGGVNISDSIPKIAPVGPPSDFMRALFPTQALESASPKQLSAPENNLKNILQNYYKIPPDFSDNFIFPILNKNFTPADLSKYYSDPRYPDKNGHKIYKKIGEITGRRRNFIKFHGADKLKYAQDKYKEDFLNYYQYGFFDKKAQAGILEDINKEYGKAFGFVPSFAGGEALARRTERGMTGSAIRSFDPRIGTYYRSAGQPANLDSLIRRDHPEGLSQAIRNSYSNQHGVTPNFAAEDVKAMEDLRAAIEALNSTVASFNQPTQTQAVGATVNNIDASNVINAQLNIDSQNIENSVRAAVSQLESRIMATLRANPVIGKSINRNNPQTA